MKRFIDIYLRQWKNQANFKPLLLRGARQVGKTYAVRELGKQFDQFVELNLESNPNVRNLFTKELDPKKIIEEVASGVPRGASGKNAKILDKNFFKIFVAVLPTILVSDTKASRPVSSTCLPDGIFLELPAPDGKITSSE